MAQTGRAVKEGGTEGTEGPQAMIRRQYTDFKIE